MHSRACSSGAKVLRETPPHPPRGGTPTDPAVRRMLIAPLDQAAKSMNIALAGRNHQLDGAALAGFEADSRASGDVERGATRAARRGRGQRRVGLVEMVWEPTWTRPVAGRPATARSGSAGRLIQFAPFAGSGEKFSPEGRVSAPRRQGQRWGSGDGVSAR